MTSIETSSGEPTGRRRIAIAAVSVVAVLAATLGILRACQDDSGVSDAYCTQMETIMGDIAGAQFAGLREGDTFSDLILHLSPRLAATLALVIENAPEESADLLELLKDNFDLGELLLKRTMGYSDEVIEQLRLVNLSENSRLADVLQPDTNPESLESASSNLAELLGSTYFERKAGETPRFRADGVDCGVFPEPDDGDCPDVLSEESVAAAFGFAVEDFADRATITWDDGNCLWTVSFEPTPENPEATDGFLWVDVFTNTVANGVLTARLSEPGDVMTQPVFVDGARHSLGVYPCGRTAYVDSDGRSATVAACAPTDLSDTTLTNLALEAIASR